jgi:hypothetical protein
MPYSRKGKEPTDVSRVEEYMRFRDDFVSMAELKAATGLDSNHVSACLYHLKKFKAADSVESLGSLWWFLTGTDLRSKIVEERVREEKPRRTRRMKPKEK